MHAMHIKNPKTKIEFNGETRTVADLIKKSYRDNNEKFSATAIYRYKNHELQKRGTIGTALPQTKKEIIRAVENGSCVYIAYDMVQISRFGSYKRQRISAIILGTREPRVAYMLKSVIPAAKY